MPRGALAQYLRALFGQKENFSVYFSGKRRSLLHLNTAQRSFFSHYNASISDRAHAPWAINSIWPSYQ